MLIFFYKSYPYAPRATIVSLIGSILALFLVVSGIGVFIEGIEEKKYILCVVAILLAAGGVLTYIFGSVKLSKKIAEKDGIKNIYTKAKYARRFVGENPETYDQMVLKNPDFAAKYVRDVNGKIVRR